MSERKEIFRKIGASTLLVMYFMTMAWTFTSHQDLSLYQPESHEFYQTGSLFDYLNHTVPVQYAETDRTAPLLLVKVDQQKLWIIQQSLETASQNHLFQVIYLVFGTPVKHLTSLILYPFHFFW